MTHDDHAATFLLIPGAGGDAWYWHRLVDEITRRGRVAIAVDLPADDPTAGLDRYVEAAVSVGREQGDVIVVGQSMGGFTAPLLCGQLPVRQLVLLNAMIPRPNETAGDWWANTGHKMPDEFDPAVHFFHDVPPEISEIALASGKEQSDRPFADPWPLDHWPDVATRVIATSDDRFFPIEFQTRVAADRLGIEPETMPGGHLVALSRPINLADVLIA